MKGVLDMGRELMYEGFCKVWKDQNGFEIVETTDSVAFLIHLTDLDKVILVSQNRPAMIGKLNSSGYITEVTAGRFDVDLTPEQLVAKEASEEVGADVDPEDVELINCGLSLALSPGIITERQILAYVAIDSSRIEKEDRVFGADEHERIRRRFIDVSMLGTSNYQDMKTFALVQWFLRTKIKK